MADRLAPGTSRGTQGDADSGSASQADLQRGREQTAARTLAIEDYREVGMSVLVAVLITEGHTSTEGWSPGDFTKWIEQIPADDIEPSAPHRDTVVCRDACRAGDA